MEPYKHGMFVEKNIGKILNREYENHVFFGPSIKFVDTQRKTVRYIAIHENIVLIDFYWGSTAASNAPNYMGKIIGRSELFYHMKQFFGWK